jgi:hypothetical protein
MKVCPRDGIACFMCDGVCLAPHPPDGPQPDRAPVPVREPDEEEARAA